MKRISTTALLIMIISCASFATKVVAEGKSFTAFGNFKVTKAVQPLIVDGVTLDTYLITYENSDMKVTVGIEKDKKCKRYITLSDKLSVQYVCDDKYFGIEKLDKKYSGLKEDAGEMNRAAYFNQRVLTPGGQDAITCMKLIGAYFPELLTSNKES